MAKKKPIVAHKGILNLLTATYGKGYFKKKVQLVDDGALRNVQPPYILVANHCGFADVGGIIMMSKPNYPNFVISATQIVKWPSIIKKLGVLPKKQFTVDTSLIRDIKHVLSKNRPVVIFPEAKLSVVGTPNPIKPAIAKLVKLLKVPLVTVCFSGSYLHKPRWAKDGRKVPLVADVKLAVTQEQVKSFSVEQIHQIIVQNLTFDDYQYQLENKISITSPTLCEGLQGILYKCPNCGAEFCMTASGNQLQCEKCHHVVEQNRFGQLQGGKFDKVTDWYQWQRQCVHNQICDDSFVLTSTFQAEMLVGKKYRQCGQCDIAFDQSGLTIKSDTLDIFFKRGTFYTLSFNNEYLYFPTEQAVYRFRRIGNLGITTKFNLAIEEQSTLDQNK